MPIRKPRKDEDQSSFMKDCMHELATESETERSQEQMVAICLNAWREGKNMKPRVNRVSADDPESARYGDVEYADPGYQEDGKARYPINTEQHIRAAWNYINKPENQTPYTKEQVASIKKRIIAAWKKKIDSDGPPGAEEKARRIGRHRKADYDGYNAPGVQEDESEDNYHERCVSSLLNQDASQEDADRLCALAWENRSTKPSRLRLKQKDDDEEEEDENDYEAPEVDEDETRAEYLERCVADLTDDGADEDEANSICSLAWENRSSAHRLRHKVHSEKMQDGWYVLSDESVDRMGDVISANGWDLTSFRRNPVALFNHRSDFLVGLWEELRIENGALRGRLKLAPEGTSERIDEIRKLVEAGILKAVSVGFHPISSKPRMMGEKRLGEHFIKQELVETSLVAVPANANALAVAKSLDVSPDTIDMVFAEHGVPPKVKQYTSSGEHAVTHRRAKEADMSLAQRITDTQQRINELRDKLTDHLANVDDSNVSDSQLEITQDMNDQIQREQKQLSALIEAEKNVMGSRALVKAGDEAQRAPTISKNGSVSKPYTYTRNAPQTPTTREQRLDVVVRTGVISFIAHVKKWPLELARENIAKEYARYGDDHTKAFCDYVSKAAVPPAMTTVTSWAEELVQQIYADYLDLLYPESVYPKLAARGLSLRFGRAGRISIPTRLQTPSISGSFVGEGQPIPVRRAAFTAQILTPKKLGVITTWTREMDESSIPAIEGLLRNAIQEDTAITLDSCLLDDEDADTLRPAGLISQTDLPDGAGAKEVTASTAPSRFEALVADLQAVTGELLTSTRGNVRDMTLIMNPQQTLAASLTALPGVSTFPFKDEIARNTLLGYTIIRSGTVEPGTVIAVDAADFVTVGGEAPRFEVSDQATLHMESDTPGPINGSSPVRSLWQTDSLGLRLILPINWAMRRSGMVAFVENVKW